MGVMIMAVMMDLSSSRSRIFFFFKQKTAYEMRISDWSSDVCSSDLRDAGGGMVMAQPPGDGARPGDFRQSQSYGEQTQPKAPMLRFYLQPASWAGERRVARAGSRWRRTRSNACWGGCRRGRGACVGRVC